MSLSLVPSPTADRSAAQARVLQSANAGQNTDISAPNPSGEEFAKLLDAADGTDIRSVLPVFVPANLAIVAEKGGLAARNAGDESGIPTQADPAQADPWADFDPAMSAAATPDQPAAQAAKADPNSVARPDLRSSPFQSIFQALQVPSSESPFFAARPQPDPSTPVSIDPDTDLAAGPDGPTMHGAPGSQVMSAVLPFGLTGGVIDMAGISIPAPVAPQIIPMTSGPAVGSGSQTAAPNALPGHLPLISPLKPGVGGRSPAPDASQRAAIPNSERAGPIPHGPALQEVTAGTEGPTTAPELSRTNPASTPFAALRTQSAQTQPTHPQLTAAYEEIAKPGLPPAIERPANASVQAEPTAILAQNAGPATPFTGAKKRDPVDIPPGWPRAKPDPGDDTAPPPITASPRNGRPGMAANLTAGPTPIVAVDGLMSDTAGSTPMVALSQRHDIGQRVVESPQASHFGRATATHVATQLAHAADQTTNGTADITLNPRELGQVKLSLQAVDGTMFVAIAAERPETAELMRRHIDTLAQEFRGLGYQDVSFSFSGRQDNTGRGSDQGSAPRDTPELPPHTDTTGDLPADRFIPRRTAEQTNGTGLDLRL